MGVLEILLTTIGGVTVSGLLLYAGNRYTAKKSAEVSHTLATIEQRKVYLTEFQEYTKRYDADMELMRADISNLREELRTTKRTLRLALGYINSLRRTLRKNNLFPDPMPESLENVFDPFSSTYFLDEE